MENKLVIADPAQWATSQGYTIQAQVASNTFAVRFGTRAIGALVPTQGGYTLTTQVSAPPPDIDYTANASDRFVSQSFGLGGLAPFALDKLATGVKEIELSDKMSGTGFTERVSDCNYWLPYAAEHYQLSRDIRDYVLVPIPAIFSDLPNTNGDGLSLSQMLRFVPDHGMQMYKTFKGKPTHIEHQNKDIRQAKGVILDSFLRPVPFNNKYYKIVLLLAYDRTKDSELCRQILAKETNAYSVGFYYQSYSCSICNLRVGRGINISPCQHTQMGRPTYKQADGRIVYRKCEDAIGFECSSVNTPAFCSAVGPHVYDTRSFQ